MPTRSAHSIASPSRGRKRVEGLTTTKAPFIERARRGNQLYIEQPYQLYSRGNHETWRRLFARMRDHWRRYANERFLEGVETLCLEPERVPRLDDVNRFLAPRTGFRAIAVSGYIPAYHFFDSIRKREFPTTITIRDGGSLDYLPEPDIFHDIAGHVPMHTDPAFADVLVRLGECARAAVAFADTVPGGETRLRVASSIVRALARFFWFSIEFGLMRSQGDLKVYGSGLLSSHGEIAHAIESVNVQRVPFQIEWVINQHFDIDRYQPLLFIVESFDHLFGLVDQLEGWMKAGRLCNVAGGEPTLSEPDLGSFIAAG